MSKEESGKSSRFCNISDTLSSKGELGNDLQVEEGINEDNAGVNAASSSDGDSSATAELAKELDDGIITDIAKVDDAIHQSRKKSQCNHSEVLVQENPKTEHVVKIKKKPLYGEDSGPKMYTVTSNLVTPVLITKNLPDQFSTLPIYGRPENKRELPQFYRNKIREFVGCDLTDQEFEKLAKYCSPDHLRTGDELQMSTKYPATGVYPASQQSNERKVINKTARISENMTLCIHKKLKLRIEKDTANMYCKKFKYRGVRIIPFPSVDDADAPIIQIGKSLEPGKELLFRVRIYRPFNHSQKQLRLKSTRHSLLQCDVIVLGRQSLAALRDRFVCANDAGVRLDHSDNPDDLPDTNAKEVFPSGFLFVNNVFYVDARSGCADQSGVVRAWAARRGRGHFPRRDLAATRLDEVPIRLGHPEVYVHQGNCEHLFTFSEVRLLGPSDPCLASLYPFHHCLSQLQSVYCTTCAEFAARWVVVGCDRVPFDPAYFCDTCFRLYLYKDGNKIGNFKAYSYKGNELNLMKPPR